MQTIYVPLVATPVTSPSLTFGRPPIVASLAQVQLEVASMERRRRRRRR